MSRSGAEKAVLVSAMLFSGAIVAVAILIFLPRGLPRPSRGENPPEVHESTTAAPAVAPIERPPDPAVPPREAPATNSASFRRERTRLREQIRVLEEEVAKLKARLVEAGVPLETPPPDPVKMAEEAIAELRLCGSDSDPRDIDRILDKAVAAGTPAVGPIREFLAGGDDLHLSDSWSFLAGSFVGYPTLRIALLDALHRIGGVEGQSALLSILKDCSGPLEICLILSQLKEVRDVPAVADACADAARRYLDIDPPRGESLVVRPVLEILRAQPPDSAAGSLVKFVVHPLRSPENAEPALRLISELPEEASLPALTGLASEEGEKAVRAARVLTDSGHEGTPRALAELFAAGEPAPEVRREVYRLIDDPVAEALTRLRRSAGGGLEALDALTRIRADLAARQGLLEGRLEREKDPVLLRILKSARDALSRFSEESELLEAGIRGE